MSIITPSDTALAYLQQLTIGQQRFDLSEQSDTTGHTATRLGGPPRWTVALRTLDALEPAVSALWKAIAVQMRGRINHLAVHDITQPQPRGNARGQMVLAAAASAGASTLAVSGLRAGANLLVEARQAATFIDTGWTLVNATISPNSDLDPGGNMTAWQLLRTATGNHYATKQFTVASTANLTVHARVWLKAGTLSGNVVLRLRDGADTEHGTATVTPTGAWAVYDVAATFSGSAAANVRLLIDPANDAGSAGDSLLSWGGAMAVMTAQETACTSWPSAVVSPFGYSAYEVRRTSAGNAFMWWSYATTSHANAVYTFSLYLRAGTYAGQVRLSLRDGADNTIAQADVTPSGSWQRFSVTGTFGSSPAANIKLYVDPLTDSGSVGEIYYRYGEQLDPGAIATDFAPRAELKAGDWLQVGAGVGSHYCMVTADAAADESGAITAAIEPPTRKAFASSTAVTWDRPKGHYKQRPDSLSWSGAAGSSMVGGFAFDLMEDWSA